MKVAQEWAFWPPDHLLAVAGHRTGIVAPYWSNEVPINRSGFGGHLM